MTFTSVMNIAFCRTFKLFVPVVVAAAAVECDVVFAIEMEWCEMNSVKHSPVARYFLHKIKEELKWAIYLWQLLLGL